MSLALGLGDVEIVTADSMQVYKGMDIGTAKPTTAERAGVPHHLVDVATPQEDWDVSRFVREASAIVDAIVARGKTALLVGGTGLYVHALVDGFSVPGRWPEVARQVDELPTDEIYRRLAELDAAAAAKIEPGNRRRAARALEVTLGGKRFSEYGPGVGAFAPTDWRLAGVWLPRQVVARRVEERFDAMVRDGLVDEVSALAQGPGLSRTSSQALGYRELLAYLRGELDWEAARRLVIDRTRQFARRQRMWWRRDPRVRWYGSPSEPSDIVPALLRDWGHAGAI